MSNHNTNGNSEPVSNWKGSITYHPNSVEIVTSKDEIIEIVSNPDKYPSPVRVRGSHHSTTKCIVADGGTVIDMRQMNKKIEIDEDKKTVTMDAGVLLIDAAKKLEEKGFQFYVNVEIGNLTVGSGACGGTKDASFYSKSDGWEYGQVCAYCVGMKTVQADGSPKSFTEETHPDLMIALRSSYGMLGIIYEVTYKIKPIKAMAVRHQEFTLDEFIDNLDELTETKRSMMLYLFPYIDRVVAEFRYESDQEMKPNSEAWEFRNKVWKTGWPGAARIIDHLTFGPLESFEDNALNFLNKKTIEVLVNKVKSDDSSPADQIIRYEDEAGFASYTFSIWAFKREDYGPILRKYFQFCKDYYRDHGYRCNLLNVGYHIKKDDKSLFSYTREWPAITFDPVSTGGEGWDDFLKAYNKFCDEHNGKPLFNQTAHLKPSQVKKAFANDIPEFLAHRKKMDPGKRFYTPWFEQLLEGEDPRPEISPK